MFSIFQSKYPTKLFTYFIPAPPQRQSGYREKQLDKIVNEILSRNLTIIDLKVTSMNSGDRAGMWIIIQFKPQCKHSNKLDINILLDDIEATVSLPMQDSNVDGLYFD